MPKRYSPLVGAILGDHTNAIKVIMSYSYSAQNPQEDKLLTNQITNSVDIHGKTPLHHCFSRNNAEAGNILLQKEIADLKTRSSYG
mmetsp:Transcript_41545/g.29932  ORF Transcript_41545/g.29932 Transcript_41545/m.29932 type:complete len:86 (-) Transcript_41545:163-420(-)